MEVIYSDKNLIIINKPAGLLVHGTAKNEVSLTDWLLKNYPEVNIVGDDPKTRPGIVHRLDKDTSGVLVIARNQQTFEYLKNLFKTGKIKKTYLALAWGKIMPKTGTIRKPIGLKSDSVKRTAHIKNAKMVKEAATEYKVKKYFKDFSLLEIRPLTGRTHQIRVHLNAIGHPIVGDQLYSKKMVPAGLYRQFLHAESVEFDLPPQAGLPDNGRIKVSADLPDDLKSFLKSLAGEDYQTNK